eukprot:s142_g18.t1
MLATQERMEEHFRLVKIFFDENWHVAARRPDGSSMTHRSGPSGGHLLKFDFRNVFVEDAPSKAADLLLLPEVRGLFSKSAESFHPDLTTRLVEVYGPGDVLVNQSWTAPVHLMICIFFGQLSGPKKVHCLYNKTPMLAWQQLRQNFPEPDDCTLVHQDLESSEECYILTFRPEAEPKHFRAVLVFQLPDDRWINWGGKFFADLLDEAYRAGCLNLNRPCIGDLRQISADYYLILSLRNFNRGCPLLPATEPTEATVVTVSTDELGMSQWQEFQSRSADGKLHLAEYLQLFLERLDLSLKIYESWGGRPLVPYQCVVLRKEWEEVRSIVLPALRFQKAAYRRLHGGTTAPSLVEDVAPRVTERKGTDELGDQLSSRVVVRKTFLELQEEVQEETLKRNKSEPTLETVEDDSLWPVWWLDFVKWRDPHGEAPEAPVTRSSLICFKVSVVNSTHGLEFHETSGGWRCAIAKGDEADDGAIWRSRGVIDLGNGWYRSKLDF